MAGYPANRNRISGTSLASSVLAPTDAYAMSARGLAASISFGPCQRS